MELDRWAAMGSEPAQWRICVVLPTRNEAATLESVVNGIRKAFVHNRLREPVIIITDDSHDGTRSLARRLGVHVVIGGGKGLGFAMHQGLKAALAFEPDVIVSMDADGQSDPYEIRRFLEPIAADEADMVVGSRFIEKGLIRYRYRWINRFGIFVLSRILRSFTRLPMTDAHGGLRAMRSEVVTELEIIGTHTYVQESIIDAHEKGFRIKEVPSIWRERTSGTSRVVGSIPKYIMYTLPVLFIRSGIHIKWLYSIGLLLMAGALLYFLFVAWEESFQFKAMFSRLPAFVLIALMIMVGVQLFSFGFLAELGKDIKSRVDRLDLSSRGTGGGSFSKGPQLQGDKVERDVPGSVNSRSDSQA
jgi:glycosyltransferase involved in cell wall biosynthesis